MSLHPIAQLALILLVGLLTAVALAPRDTCRTGGITTILKGDRL